LACALPVSVSGPESPIRFSTVAPTVSCSAVRPSSLACPSASAVIAPLPLETL
jgi:hypothetical protein